MWLALVACLGLDRREPIRVFAAASLTDVLADLEATYEARHPDRDVQIVTGGSQVLALQVAQGAPADLLLVADARPLGPLGDRLGPARPMAGNRLVVVVVAEHPLRDARDLDTVDSLVVGLPESPIGRYTREALDRATRAQGDGWRAAVDRRIVSEESHVRLVRTKVELGVADAAIVYASDVSPHDDRLRAVRLPDAWQPDVRYHVAPTDLAGPAALDFLGTLLGPPGHGALTDHGFEPAP